MPLLIDCWVPRARRSTVCIWVAGRRCCRHLSAGTRAASWEGDGPTPEQSRGQTREAGPTRRDQFLWRRIRAVCSMQPSVPPHHPPPPHPGHHFSCLSCPRPDRLAPRERGATSDLETPTPEVVSRMAGCLCHKTHRKMGGPAPPAKAESSRSQDPAVAVLPSTACTTCTHSPSWRPAPEMRDPAWHGSIAGCWQSRNSGMDPRCWPWRGVDDGQGGAHSRYST